MKTTENDKDDKDVKYNKQHSFSVIASVVRWHKKRTFVMKICGFYLNDGLTKKLEIFFFL